VPLSASDLLVNARGESGVGHVDLAGVPPDAFDVVVVDEFHRAAAATYRRLLEHLRPPMS
jgi:superfamily II DNA or RNA helicase